MAWQPVWQLLVAFNNGAQDDPGLITSVASPAGTLGANNVWTDISPFVEGEVSTNRGRQHEVDKFQTGTLACILLNNDGRFNSWNTSGPYTGKITPGVPVQLRATFSSTVYYQFTGVADTWATVWAAENRTQVQLKCVDQFANFNNAYVQSNYDSQVIADGAAAYWKLNDPSGSSALDSSGNNQTGFYAGTPTYSQTPMSVAMSDATISFGSQASGATGFVAMQQIPAVTGPSWSVEAWVNVTDAAVQAVWGSNPAQVVEFGWSGGGTMGLLVQHNGAVTRVMSEAPFVGGGSVGDGSWHYLCMTFSSGTITVYVDAVSVATGASAAGFPVGPVVVAGATAPREPTLPGSVAQVAIYNLSLSGTTITKHYALGQAAVQEASGARIGRVLDWIGWPSAARTLDAGSSQMQTATSDLTASSAISYMQTVEQSEMGAFFMTGDGKARFISRATVLTENQLVGSVATFGDGGGAEIPFELNPQIALDTQDLYGSVQLTRTGGVAQTAGTGSRTYQASGLLNTTDLEVLNYANWLAAQLGTAVPRIRSVTIHPFVDPTGAATTSVLGLELMQIVTVNRHKVPGAGSAFSQTAFVEGINFHVYPATGDFNVDLQLTPVGPPVWILGTSQLGTTTRLAW